MIVNLEKIKKLCLVMIILKFKLKNYMKIKNFLNLQQTPKKIYKVKKI